MGYYSEVALVIQKKFFKWPNEPKCEWMRECYKEEKFRGTEVVLLYFDNVKWYDYFDDVAAIYTLMAKWDAIADYGYDPDDQESVNTAACSILETGDVDTTPIYGFVRLGEEFGDIEYRGDPVYYGIYPEQRLCVELRG